MTNVYLKIVLLMSLLANTGFSDTKGMIFLKGGEFSMGCGNECPMDDAKPVHKVKVSAFWIDETPVTNLQFSKFAEATKFSTEAEKLPDASDYPLVAKDNLVAGSAVFESADVGLENPLAWWSLVKGAFWKHVNGPDSPDAAKSLSDRPVVHVSYEDALSYCRWAGGDLPTEAQYEYAARGGLSRKRYAWGDDLNPSGKWLANIWQGKFPKNNTAEDGYSGVSPVKAFPPNGYGLYDMAGNVWHWTKDWYRFDTYSWRVAEKESNVDPSGPAESLDPSDPDTPKRVQRGGSHLCSAQYCTRYLVGSRGRGEPGSSSSNLGFRCVKNTAQK